MVPLAYGLGLFFACLGLGVDAANHHQHSPRDDTPPYSPIPPSVLSDVEFRANSTAPASTGSYIATGLGAEMDLVTQEYGLRDSESFYWGLDGMPLANLTAFADGEDVKVLSVERFDGVLDSAQCTNSSVTLTFTQSTQFQDVQSAWTWINSAAQNYVVLVTNTSQCNAPDGDATDRQPWHVTHATFDDRNNTVELDAQPKTWNEAFGSWHLTVDTRGLLPAEGVRRRISKTEDIDLGKDFSGQTFPLPDGNSVFCTSCSTSGQLQLVMKFDYELENSNLEADFNIVANGVGTALDIDINIEQDAGTQATFPIITWTPGAGTVDIPDLIKAYPELIFGFTGSILMTSDVVISTGVTASVEDDSQASLDFSSADSDHFETNKSGWNTSFQYHNTSISGSVEVKGTIGPSLTLKYHAQTEGLASEKYNASGDVGLFLIAPELILSATVFEKENASSYSCPTPVDEFGVSFQVELGVELDAFEDIQIPDDVTESTTQTLYATATTLYSTCLLSTASIADKSGGGAPTGSTYPLPTANGTSPGSGYAPYGSAPCANHGQLVCNGANYFALCNWGTAIWQPVANGTACEDGAIVGVGLYADPPVYPTDSNSASCSINGQLLCNGASQFGLCNWGRVVWQPVAAGTQCQSGQIVKRGAVVEATPAPTPAPMRRKRMIRG